jgi:PAS domain S-box-containing protein
MSVDSRSTQPGETLEELYDRAPCGYLTTTLDGRIVRANATLSDWLGYAHAELVGGRRVQDLLNVVGRIYFDTHLLPHLSLSGEVGEVAFDLVRADGATVPCLLHASIKVDAAGTPALYRFTLFNVKERRRYEREMLAARREAERATAALKELYASLEQRVREEVERRLKAEAALRQAQKMDALGQLTGGVAHDFNNLLTVIMGGLDTIVKQLDAAPVSTQTARQRRAAHMALQGAQAAAGLTHRLLAFSRQQPLNPKPVELNGSVGGVSELLRRTLGEGIALQTVLAASLWHTRIDTNQLENALLNLAVNARDAMPRGGQLTIETSNSHLDESYVAQLALDIPPGQYVCVAVTDTGVGMDAATIERVFEPFFTTKELGKGTGLGLSQVYGFVRQSGGDVKIYSEPNRGTTVKMYLPRYIATSAELEQRTELAGDAMGKGETVLVVEDNELVREHAGHALEELGYRVLEAGDVESALQIVGSSSLPDLLFTDVVLRGGFSGVQLAERALALRPKMKVLFTSGYGWNAVARQEDVPNGSAFIKKPYTTAALAREARKLLDSSTADR